MGYVTKLWDQTKGVESIYTRSAICFFKATIYSDKITLIVFALFVQAFFIAHLLSDSFLLRTCFCPAKGICIDDCRGSNSFFLVGRILGREVSGC